MALAFAGAHVLPTDLGDDLTMRRSGRADADALSDFNRMIHREPGAATPDEGIAAWTRDLLDGRHPTFSSDDFTIVEEKASGRIVSSLNLISQTWTYAGVPFTVGRPELVGTAPEYRGRGLVRAQFEVVHQWSAERGELVQAITGIPYFYRQFGYEMALLLGGGRRGYPAEFPVLKAGEAEPFVLRAAVEADLPFVLAVDLHAARRSLVYCPRDEAKWRYEIFGKSGANVNRLDWTILERPDGKASGVVGCMHGLEGGRLGVAYAELASGVSWLEAAPSILRGLAALGAERAAQQGRSLSAVALWSGAEHPLIEAADSLLPHIRRPYAWYLRVPDLPGFTRHIAPVLEQRLAGSVASGHCGELKISFYRQGLRIVFEQGRLAEVSAWQPSHDDPGAAGFPGLSFLQMVFGYRRLADLQAASADCWVSGDEARVLLCALFPCQASGFWPVA